MMRFVRMPIALAAAVVWLAAAQASAQGSPAAPSDNPEIAAMFEADQADRAAAPVNWAVVAPRDRARLARMAELLEAGAVHTGQDFHYAAVLYEHGTRPSDYLTAHVLAMAALERGRTEAQQLAAASLDRYLLSIGQRQVLGTQFARVDGRIEQPDYDREALPESVRSAVGQSREALEQRRRKLAPYIKPAPPVQR
jgi:hypothetical protein